MSEAEPTVAYPTLSKAPIVQVAAELRTAASTEWSREKLEEELTPLFPEMQRKDFFEHSAEFSVGEEEIQSKRTPPIWQGLFFASPDGREAVHFRRDRFVVTRLAPYPGWEAFVATLKERWAVHRRIAGSNPVTRFGLRFINRISLGASPVDLDDVLRYGPKDYPNQRLMVAGFLHRDQMVEPSETYSLQIIRQSANVVPAGSQRVEEFGVTVDVDVFTMRDWSGSPEDMDQHLTAMRSLKNNVFFGSLTEKARLSLQ